MARSHFTLAALATSAVDGLEVVGAQPFGSAGGDFDSALLTGSDGRHWLIRVPRNERAQSEQSADLLALRSLSTGIRARLPFSVATFAGQVPAGPTRAVVTEFVYGTKVPLAHLDVELAASIGEAIAAIHALPPSLVADAGLPAHSAPETQRATTALIERAGATGLVPASLLARWESAMTESVLWQFAPVVINGALSSDSFLSADGNVTGVLGWHGLRVGDPARDLQWLLGSRDDQVAEAAFAAYTRVRGSVDRHLRPRAQLLAELEVARWLLHGTEVHDPGIVDDAVEMLTGIADDARKDLMNPIGAQAIPVLGVDEVEHLLDTAEAGAGRQPTWYA